MSSSSPGTIRLTKYTLGIIAIVLFGVFIRLYGLDRMAFHHDESIHALFSWRLYQGMFEAYKYDPTYHGPFLYHTGALFFSLFGDNDFVARLPFVTFGVLLFYLIWRAKDWLGQTGTLVTLFLVATSPSMTYFARFARNDVYMAAFAMGIVAFALDYLRTRKDIYLVWMTIFLTLMYSCKENSYMTGFILGSYIVFYGVYYFLSYAPGIRKQGCVEIIGKRAPFVKLLSLYGIFSCTAFSLVYFVTRLELFKTTATARKEMVMAESYNIGILQHAWNHVTQSHSWIVPMWIWVGLAATAAVFLLLLFIQYRIKSEGETFSLRRIARENAVVLTCILIALLIYSFLFTTMGHNRTGMKAGVVDYLLYWMGQQDNPRIEGEASYFIPRILLYEPMTVVFAVIAFLVYTFSAFSWRNFLAFQFTFWSTVNLYCQVVLLHGENAALALVLWILSLCVVLGLFIITRLFPSRSESPDAQEESGWRPDGVRVFFIYWSVFSLLIYAALNEKVPWLMVHQVQPLILLAGIFIGDVLDRLPSPALRRVFIALLVVLAVYEVRTNIHLNMYNNDNPRESIVYTQSSHDVVETVKMVEEGARRLGQEYCPPSATKAVVCYHEQTTWPYSWYFRNYKYEISNTVPRSEVPFVITVSGLEDQIKVWGKGKYAQKKIDHRVWWPYGQSVLPFSYFTQRNQSQTDAWKALWNYVLYRELWGGLRPGGMQALLYYREPLKDPEERPAVPAGYDEPVKPLIPMTAVGTYGQGEAQFNEPRGLAFAPDGNTMYVLDARNGRIQVFDKNLQFIAMFGGPGTGDGQFSTPEIAKVGNGPNGGIAVGPDGTIYVTDTWYNSQNPPVNGRIVRFKPDGTPLPSILPASNAPFFYPRGVAVSSNGNIFVADTGQNRIVLFDAQGQFVRILGENAFTEPVGITVGPDGLVYVCDVGGQRVVSFTQEGQYVRHWAIMGWNASNELPLPWIEPYIAVDQQGSVYVTDASTNTIHKLYKEGQKVVQAGGKGTGRNQLNAPKGITIDEAGNVYIADSRNYRILKVRLPG